jgi:elongation factor 1-gamma
VFNNETQVDRYAIAIHYKHLGYFKMDAEMEAMSYTFLDRNLTFYNDLLATKDYLVADQLTLADIFFFFSLLNPWKAVVSEERKAKFANVTKYMERLTKDQRFAKILANAN